MAEIIGVRFKEVGKVYYFDPLDNKLNTGDRVIVETARGLAERLQLRTRPLTMRKFRIRSSR